MLLRQGSEYLVCICCPIVTSQVTNSEIHRDLIAEESERLFSYVTDISTSDKIMLLNEDGNVCFNEYDTRNGTVRM